MKNGLLIIRRTHLYLGMLMLPWLGIYALSTALLNHVDVRRGRPGETIWEPWWERDYRLELPAGQAELREATERMLRAQGIDGAFAVQRQGTRLNITVQNFRRPLRLNYDAERGRLRAEARRFSWGELLVRLHERTGYGRGGILRNVWAFIVDVFCVGTLVWVATGLILWWKVPGARLWGWLTLGGGIVTLLALLFSL